MRRAVIDAAPVLRAYVQRQGGNVGGRRLLLSVFGKLIISGVRAAKRQIRDEDRFSRADFRALKGPGCRYRQRVAVEQSPEGYAVIAKRRVRVTVIRLALRRDSAYENLPPRNRDRRASADALRAFHLHAVKDGITPRVRVLRAYVGVGAVLALAVGYRRAVGGRDRDAVRLAVVDAAVARRAHVQRIGQDVGARRALLSAFGQAIVPRAPAAKRQIRDDDRLSVSDFRVLEGARRADAQRVAVEQAVKRGPGDNQSRVRGAVPELISRRDARNGHFPFRNRYRFASADGYEAGQLHFVVYRIRSGVRITWADGAIFAACAFAVRHGGPGRRGDGDTVRRAVVDSLIARRAHVHRRFRYRERYGNVFRKLIIIVGQSDGCGDVFAGLRLFARDRYGALVAIYQTLRRGRRQFRRAVIRKRRVGPCQADGLFRNRHGRVSVDRLRALHRHLIIYRIRSGVGIAWADGVIFAACAFAVRHDGPGRRRHGDTVRRAVVDSLIARRADIYGRFRYRERYGNVFRKLIIIVGQGDGCRGIFAGLRLFARDGYGALVAVREALRRGGRQFRRAVIRKRRVAPCQRHALRGDDKIRFRLTCGVVLRGGDSRPDRIFPGVRRDRAAVRIIRRAFGLVLVSHGGAFGIPADRRRVRRIAIRPALQRHGRRASRRADGKRRASADGIVSAVNVRKRHRRRSRVRVVGVCHRILAAWDGHAVFRYRNGRLFRRPVVGIAILRKRDVERRRRRADCERRASADGIVSAVNVRKRHRRRSRVRVVGVCHRILAAWDGHAVFRYRNGRLFRRPVVGIAILRKRDVERRRRRADCERRASADGIVSAVNVRKRHRRRSRVRVVGVCHRILAAWDGQAVFRNRNGRLFRRPVVDVAVLRKRNVKRPRRRANRKRRASADGIVSAVNVRKRHRRRSRVRVVGVCHRILAAWDGHAVFRYRNGRLFRRPVIDVAVLRKRNVERPRRRGNRHGYARFLRIGMAIVADNFVINRIRSGVRRRRDGFRVFAVTAQLILNRPARSRARRHKRLFRAVIGQRLRGGGRVQRRGGRIRDDFLSVGVSAGKRLRRQDGAFPVNDEIFLKRHASDVGGGGNAVVVKVRPAKGERSGAKARAGFAARRRHGSAADGNRAARISAAAANSRARTVADGGHSPAADGNRAAHAALVRVAPIVAAAADSRRVSRAGCRDSSPGNGNRAARALSRAAADSRRAVGAALRDDFAARYQDFSAVSGKAAADTRAAVDGTPSRRDRAAVNPDRAVKGAVVTAAADTRRALSACRRDASAVNRDDAAGIAVIASRVADSGAFAPAGSDNRAAVNRKRAAGRGVSLFHSHFGYGFPADTRAAFFGFFVPFFIAVCGQFARAAALGVNIERVTP